VNAPCISTLAKEHPNLQSIFWMRTIKGMMDLESKIILEEHFCTRCFDLQNALETLNNCFQLVIYNDWFKWLVISCLPHLSCNFHVYGWGIGNTLATST
jgi:hypothetical protein